MSFLPIWETMEERTLLSTMIWTNSSGGNWDTASNWVNQGNSADHHVPTASDDAVLDLTGITVTHSAGTDTVQNVTSSSNLTLSGRLLTDLHQIITRLDVVLVWLGVAPCRL